MEQKWGKYRKASIDMSLFLSILGQIDVNYCLVMVMMEYVMKIKRKVLLVGLLAFSIGFSNSINAYTREDLEKYRTINAVISIGSIASAIDIKEHGRHFNRILADFSMASMLADNILSAALEKNNHILTQIIDQANGIIMSRGQELLAAKIVMGIIRIILTYWLFDVIKEKYPLAEQGFTRRKLRVFVRATLETIFYPLNERERRGFIDLFFSRATAFAESFLGGAIIECFGAAIANNIEEKAQREPLKQSANLV